MIHRQPCATAFRLALAVAALVAGCATPPPSAPPTAAPEPAPAAVPQSAPVAPAPDLTPAQARAQAQKLAIEAVDQLQNGDEAGARATLDKALEIDPSSDLARKLMDQIRADAEKELGPTFFRYTVQRDETLSKIAQQFLGDRFRFYILAKYNGIANPSRVAAGQVIKVPGKAPPPAARAPAEAEAKPEAAPAPALSAAPARDGTGLLAKGVELQKAGNLEGAYAAFSEAVQKDPGNRDAVMQRDAVKQALVRAYDREATQAFQRQNLDLAVSKWDRILQLEPANQKARLERERALELKKKMNEKFGAK